MQTYPRSRAVTRALLALIALAAVLAVGQPVVFATSPITCPSGPSVTLLVDASVSGGAGDGSTWGNAYATLSGALVTAQACPNISQIWVAQGTYKPTAGTDRSATFRLRNNLALYGGFTSGQSALADRNPNPATNGTTLSGDIGTAANSSDNSYHVVTGSGTDNTAVLDGFTVSGGNASVAGGDCSGNSCGGGMFNVGGSPTVTNVIFSGNNAFRGGGGMLNNIDGQVPSRPTVTNVIFSGNSADTGGGMQNNYSNPILANVVFSGNSAGSGGAVYNAGLPPSDTPTALINVTFSGNSASDNGGAVYNVNSRVAIRNSILWGDSAPSNSEILTDTSSNNSKTWVSYSIVQGSGGSGSAWWDQEAPNKPGTFDNGGNLDTNPLFVAPPTNPRLQYASPAINAGANTYVPGFVTTDPDGAPRVVGGTVDMGAYESPCPAPGSIIYVNGSASGANNGSNWSNAYTTLTAALAGVPPTPANACAEIWVAQGTYKPTSGADRTRSFTLLNNVAIYGGFTSGQTSLSDRIANSATNNTVLSGDIGTPSEPSDNSYHVVTGSGTNYSAILDGFTITGGAASDSQYPNDRGGGIFMASASPTLVNLTVRGNSATFGGGGLYIAGGSPSLTNVTFSGNAASAYDARGGGMVVSSGSPTLTNVTFSGNSAGEGGGMYNGSSNPILTNVTFSGNSGLGMANAYSNPQIRNSIFWGDGDGEIWNLNSQPVVSYSIVQGGYTGAINADPKFIAPITAPAPTTTGNLRLGPDSAAFNSGRNAFVPFGLTTDLDGAPRIVFNIVDMGAYERQDNTPPNTTIWPPVPSNPTRSTSAEFTFSGSDNMTPSDELTFQCNLDNLGWQSCVSRKTYTNLSDGSHTFEVRAVDAAGNADPTPASYIWLVDTTAPTVTLNPAANICATPGSNGWCRGTQTAGFTASDAGSGVVSPPCSGPSCNFTQSTTTNGSAVTIASGQVCDAVGNCNPGINAGPFKIDSVAPTLSPTISPNPPTLGGAATASPNASDATSGVATQSCDAVNTSSVGAKTLTCTATDNAGNTTTVQVNYSVGYAVSPVSPIVGPPGVNSLYPTSIGTTATPVRWKITNASGTPVTAAGTVTDIRYKPTSCSSFTTDPTGATAASMTSANPRYDTLQRLWMYNWTLPGRGCYTLFITLSGGQVIPLFYHIY